MVPVALTMLLGSLLVACDSGSGDGATDPTGTLIFTANGEDFARQGFVTEDGWTLTFDHVYMNIFGPTAFQVAEELPQGLLMAHAGHPHAEIPEGAAHVALLGSYFMDLAQGDSPLKMGELESPVGNYNRLNFDIVPATEDSDGLDTDYLGYSIVLKGTATKDDMTIAFTIALDDTIHFVGCGPNPDPIGVLAEGGEAYAETTFHLDHVFGNQAEGPADTTDPETVNFMAVGFGPFADMAQDGKLDVTNDDLENMPKYQNFKDALYTIGHTGEAHCDVQQ